MLRVHGELGMGGDQENSGTGNGHGKNWNPVKFDFERLAPEAGTFFSLII